MRLCVLPLLTLTLALPVFAAGDGVLEINQACVASGCFSGDAPGFPVTLSQVGSYVFTSNLDVTSEANPENVTAIVVDVAGTDVVTIDLNGFGIFGATFCPGTPPSSCSPTGTGIGPPTISF